MRFYCAKAFLDGAGTIGRRRALLPRSCAASHGAPAPGAVCGDRPRHQRRDHCHGGHRRQWWVVHEPAPDLPGRPRLGYGLTARPTSRVDVGPGIARRHRVAWWPSFHGGGHVHASSLQALLDDGRAYGFPAELRDAQTSSTRSKSMPAIPSRACCTATRTPGTCTSTTQAGAASSTLRSYRPATGPRTLPITWVACSRSTIDVPTSANWSATI